MKILRLAALESETLVNNILELYLNTEQVPHAEDVEKYVRYEQQPDPITGPAIQDVDLDSYDQLLGDEGEEEDKAA